MLTQFILAKRRSGMTRSDFRRYYVGVHGPLVRDTPGPCDVVTRYRQNLVVGQQEEVGRWRPPTFDAITEISFADIHAYRSRVTHSAYRDLLLPDVAHFGDAGASSVLLAEQTSVFKSALAEGAIALRLLGSDVVDDNFLPWADDLVCASTGRFLAMDGSKPPFIGFQRFGFADLSALKQFLRGSRHHADVYASPAIVLVALPGLGW